MVLTIICAFVFPAPCRKTVYQSNYGYCGAGRLTQAIQTCFEKCGERIDLIFMRMTLDFDWDKATYPGKKMVISISKAF
jgi:hypothetical protein